MNISESAAEAPLPDDRPDPVRRRLIESLAGLVLWPGTELSLDPGDPRDLIEHFGDGAGTAPGTAAGAGAPPGAVETGAHERPGLIDPDPGEPTERQLGPETVEPVPDAVRPDSSSPPGPTDVPDVDSATDGGSSPSTDSSAAPPELDAGSANPPDGISPDPVAEPPLAGASPSVDAPAGTPSRAADAREPVDASTPAPSGGDGTDGGKTMASEARTNSPEPKSGQEPEPTAVEPVPARQAPVDSAEGSKAGASEDTTRRAPEPEEIEGTTGELDADDPSEASIELAPEPEPYAVAPIRPLRVAPGIEGFGADTAAGRGGRIIVVDTLASGGPGSFAEAMATPGPRRVLFDVGGVIELPPRGLFIAEGDVSVYGQSARGDGVELRGTSKDGFRAIAIQASNVLLQHLRIRRGAGPAGEGPAKGGTWGTNDSLAIGTFSGAPASRIVVDHCSISWATDETVDLFNRTHDVTFSNCLIYENLHTSTDDFGTSGRNTFVNSGCERISFNRCVMAMGTTRFPEFQDARDWDVFNNIVYGYHSGTEAQAMGGANVRGNVVANLYIDVFGKALKEVTVFPNGRGGSGEVRLHVAGNGRIDGDAWAITPIRVAGPNGPLKANHPMVSAAEIAAPRPPRLALSSLESALLPTVGASRPGRDSADRRVIDHVRGRTGSLVDCVGGGVATLANDRCRRDVPWPTLKGGPSRLGRGPDRVPEAWKIANGLAPDVDAASTDSNGDGYHDIEDWLAGLG